MGRFTSPAKQAAAVMKVLQGHVIKSVGTARNYEQAFRRIGEFLKENRLGSLRSLTIESAIKYLEMRSQDC